MSEQPAETTPQIDIEEDARECNDCGAQLRVGSLNNDFGIYCDCTLDGTGPFKSLTFGFNWPERWEQ